MSIRRFDFLKPSSRQSQECLKKNLLEKYRTDPIGYLKDKLGITPWAGVDSDGQKELLEDIGASVKAQLAGQLAIKIFRVEAGHGVGKTYIGAGIVNWFFDCFTRSITQTSAPTSEQVKLLLWKNIKTQREGRGLGGRVLEDDPKMTRGPDWFALGRTTSNAHGKGSERAQGQHHNFMLMLLDEAEGVPDFYFDAIDAMMTGGEVIIVLMLANPKTRSSRFFKMGRQSGVKNYRLSVLDHPNVVYGKNIVKGATTREWAAERIGRWSEPVAEHSVDDYTFEVPFEVEKEGVIYPAGTIWLPNAECCFRVLGIPPANLADNVFVSPGRYEAAQKNLPLAGEEHKARFGVDCARFGADMGTIYARTAGKAYRVAQVAQGNTWAYVEAFKKEAFRLAAAGVTDCEVRVDGTGGFGIGVIDYLLADLDLRELFDVFDVVEVQFGSSAYANETYANLVTEMYAEAGETLKGLQLERVPPELEIDLTERTYGFVNLGGRSLKQLTDKEKFRKVAGRSPDDGDGFVLAVAPDHIFDRHVLEILK